MRAASNTGFTVFQTCFMLLAKSFFLQNELEFDLDQNDGLIFENLKYIQMICRSFYASNTVVCRLCSELVILWWFVTYILTLKGFILHDMLN